MPADSPCARAEREASRVRYSWNRANGGPLSDRNRRHRAIAGVLAVAVAASVGLTACDASASAPIEVTDARMARPIASEAAAYLTVHNAGDRDDRLLSVSSAKAAAVVLHRTLVDSSGQVTMDDGDGLPVKSGATVRLRPGADHLMVVGADRLDVGDTLPLDLRFARAGEVHVSVRVVRLVEPEGPG